MGNTLFIVWRESIEAMLVLGILHGWLSARPDARAGFPWLWGGVATGLVLAGLLALTLMGIQVWVSDTALEWFQALMPLVASVLIFQMVWWMHRHGAGFKRELESGMTDAAERANWMGMAVLAAMAVGREGAETVVFLYGAAGNESLADFLLGGAGGFLLALAAYWLLSRSGRFISWKGFFRLTEVLLPLLGGALLVDAVERLVGLEALPALVDPLWDTSALLDDSSRVGGVAAAFTGYRALPSGMAYALLLGYWLLAAPLLFPARRTGQKA